MKKPNLNNSLNELVENTNIGFQLFVSQYISVGMADINKFCTTSDQTPHPLYAITMVVLIETTDEQSVTIDIFLNLNCLFN